MSHFILEPSGFEEVTRLPADAKKAWLKATLKEIGNLINNQIFLMDYLDKGDPVTPYMDIYKSNIQSDRSLDKLKFRIVVRGNFHNKEMIGETWDPT